MDKVDLAILRLVQPDATLAVAKIAEEVGISKSACWRRIQSLEESGVIKQRRTILDHAKLGLGLTVFIFVRSSQHNRQWVEKFKRTVDEIPGILEVYRMGGEVDYLLKALVKDIRAYDQLYQKLIQADLLDVTAGFVMEDIKSTQVLPI